MVTVKHEIMVWSTKKQIDFVELDQKLHHVFNGVDRPSVKQIKWSNSKKCAAVISTFFITQENAQSIFNEYLKRRKNG